MGVGGVGSDFGVVWVVLGVGLISFLKLEITTMIMSFDFLIQLRDTPVTLYVAFVA